MKEMTVVIDTEKLKSEEYSDILEKASYLAWGHVPNERDWFRTVMNRQGVCSSCGQMMSHHLDEPLASCKCGTSEWNELTPFMKLESQNQLLRSLLGAVYQVLGAHDVDSYILDQVLSAANGECFSSDFLPYTVDDDIPF